jgi:hypothetical protein
MFGKASNQKKLEQLRQRAAALGRKRDEAKSALEEAAAARQRHHLEGDLEDGKTSAKLQAQVDSAASVLRGLEDAVAALTPQLAEVEQQLADEQQRAECKAASGKLDLEVAAIEGKLAPWLAATRELAGLWEKLAVLRFEAGAIARYLTNAAGEAEVAANVTLVDLHGAVKAIADGREAVPRPLPVLIVAPALPAPKLETVFTLQLGMFVDVTGTVRRVPRYTFVELTAEQAKHALRMGGICDKDDPRIRELRKKIATQELPEPHLCANWDTGEPPVGDANLWARRSSTGGTVFEPIDRGPPRTMKAPAAPAAAARSLTGEGDE